MLMSFRAESIARESNVEMIQNQPLTSLSYNYNKGNIQQDPPLTEEYFVDDIYISTFLPSALSVKSTV